MPDRSEISERHHLEKMIADNLPDTGLPIEERVMQTMANLASAYSEELDSLRVPFIEDPALPENNLASSYSLDDFVQFVSKLNEHLDLLADEGTDNSVWKKILGDNFPSGNAPSSSMALAKAIGQDRALSVSTSRSPTSPYSRQNLTRLSARPSRSPRDIRMNSKTTVLSYRKTQP